MISINKNLSKKNCCNFLKILIHEAVQNNEISDVKYFSTEYLKFKKDIFETKECSEKEFLNAKEIFQKCEQIN